MNKKYIGFLAPLSFLIIALSFAYYMVYWLPNKQKADQEIEKAKVEQSTKELEYKKAHDEDLKQEKLAKDHTLKTCQEEAAENVDLTSISYFINSIDDARSAMDAYIENCMRRSGYSDF